MTSILSNLLILIPNGWVGPILSVATETEETHSGPPHLPSLIEMMFGTEGAAHHWINVIYAFVIAIFFSIIAIVVYARKKDIPGPFQNLIEMLVEGMYNFIHPILGKDTRHFIPFIGTIFFYVLAMNLMGIVPLGHAPTTSINITASLAILVFLYAQYTGVRRLGIVGYVDHLAGTPRDMTTWCLVPLMFPLHIIGELAKPFSLAVRLFGNITGEDVLVAAFVMLGLSALSFVHSPIGLPLNVPFIMLGMLLSTIQALVFTLLSTIYILLMLPHEEHH